MRRMGRWSFGSRFEINRSTFDKYMREKRFFLHFRSQWPCVLGIWPIELKFAHLVTLVQGDVCTELEVSSFYGFPASRQSEAGDGWTDRQTGTALNEAPFESRTFDHVPIYTVGHKKSRHFYFFDNTGKYWPIVVIFSLLYTKMNCGIRTCYNFRLTLNLLPHYLVKLEM